MPNSKGVDPAFPLPNTETHYWEGLTKREYMATQFMAAILANAAHWDLATRDEPVELAVMYANLLLKHLE